MSVTHGLFNVSTTISKGVYAFNSVVAKMKEMASHMHNFTAMSNEEGHLIYNEISTNMQNLLTDLTIGMNTVVNHFNSLQSSADHVISELRGNDTDLHKMMCTKELNEAKTFFDAAYNKTSKLKNIVKDAMELDTELQQFHIKNLYNANLELKHFNKTLIDTVHKCDEVLNITDKQVEKLFSYQEAFNISNELEDKAESAVEYFIDTEF